jgi:hypothetical protein
MTMREPDFQTMSVRIPNDVKTWLEQESARNGRNQGAEIVQTLKARIAAEQRKREKAG